MGLAVDTPTRAPPAPADPSSPAGAEASAGRPDITDSASATSSTVAAIGPDSAMRPQLSPARVVGTTPEPGLMVTRPQAAAGMRSEPIPSSPTANGTIPEAKIGRASCRGREEGAGGRGEG